MLCCYRILKCNTHTFFFPPQVLPALIQPLKHVFADETFNGEPATEPSSVLGEAEVRRPWER